MSMASLIKKLKALDGMSCEAGFFETSRYEDGEQVASVAYDNEMGVKANKKTNEKGQPPRPFFRYGIRLAQKEVQTVAQRAMIMMFQNSLSPEQVVGRIGLHFEACIVDSIRNGNWIRNSQETIDRKGFDKPLIDSGLMWQSVASRVTNRGE